MIENIESKQPVPANILKARETIKKHKSMFCHIFSCKIQSNHLSCKTIKHLNQIFIEAKWFYNHCIQNLDNLSEVDTTIKFVSVKTPTKLEERPFKALSSAMKQSIKQSIFTSLKTFNTIRQKNKNLKKGQKPTKVGKLKFKKSCLSIPLSAHGTKYAYNTDLNSNRIKLQGLQPWLKCNGMDQIIENSEIANAVLVKKGNSFYIHITTYSHQQRQHKTKLTKSNIPLGIDLGCTNQITTSEGHELQFNIQPHVGIKKLDRKIMKKDYKGKYRNKSGKNKLKDQAKRSKLYEKQKNQRDDIRNKVVSFIKRSYKTIVLQDDNIAAWKKGGHGKKIQGTGIGRIKRDLKNKSEVSILVSQWFASSQTCSSCGFKQKMARGIETYVCPQCQMALHRDVNGATTIRNEGLKLNEKTLIQENLKRYYKSLKEEDNKKESDLIKNKVETKTWMKQMQTGLEFLADSSASCENNEEQDISKWGKHSDGSLAVVEGKQKLQERAVTAFELWKSLNTIPSVGCKLLSKIEEAPAL